MAHSEDEETEDGTRKRSRASEDLEGTADSSPSAPPPPEEPLNAVPLRVMPPAKTTKKPRLDSAWQQLDAHQLVSAFTVHTLIALLT